MLMPRVSAGFLISSTMCGDSQDDDIRLSPDCGGDDLVLEAGGSSGEMANGVRGKWTNEPSKSSAAAVERFLTGELATQ